MKKLVKNAIIRGNDFFLKTSRFLGIESHYVRLRRRLCLLFEECVQLNADVKKVFKYGNVAMNRWVIDSEKHIAFLHIPNTGGAIVINSIYESDGSYDIFSSLEEIKKSDINDVSRGRVLAKDINFQGFRFTYVRNPFERLVSIYDSCVGKTVQYKRYFFGYLEVENFEKWIQRLVRIPYFWMEDHISSQYRHVYKNGKPLVSYVGKFENIDTNFPKIIKKYNLGKLIERKRTPKSKGNWMDYYSEKSAALVYKKFRKDFLAFGYRDEYVKLMEYLKTKQLKEWTEE